MDMQLTDKLQPLFHWLAKKEGVRFFLGSALGAVVDLGIGIATLAVLGISTYAASSVGFCAGVIVAYIAHQKFTFGTTKTKLSFSKFIHFSITSILVILTRFGVLFVCSKAFSVENTIIESIQLMTAIGISFCLNYGIAKYIVFKNKV